MCYSNTIFKRYYTALKAISISPHAGRSLRRACRVANHGVVASEWHDWSGKQAKVSSERTGVILTDTRQDRAELVTM